MAQIEFKLNEEHRAVAFATTLEDDLCACYVAAFRSAMLSFGFSEATIDDHIKVADGE